MGHLGKGEYEKWLKSSSCHIYTTHPFVASWSLVEAYCCGINIIGSDIEAVKEICSPSTGVTFCDHREYGEIAKGVLNILDTITTEKSSAWWSQARELDRYGVETSLEAWGHVAGVDLTTTN